MTLLRSRQKNKQVSYAEQEETLEQDEEMQEQATTNEPSDDLDMLDSKPNFEEQQDATSSPVPIATRRKRRVTNKTRSQTNANNSEADDDDADFAPVTRSTRRAAAKKTVNYNDDEETDELKNNDNNDNAAHEEEEPIESSDTSEEEEETTPQEPESEQQAADDDAYQSTSSSDDNDDDDDEEEDYYEPTPKKKKVYTAKKKKNATTTAAATRSKRTAKRVVHSSSESEDGEAEAAATTVPVTPKEKPQEYKPFQVHDPDEEEQILQEAKSITYAAAVTTSAEAPEQQPLIDDAAIPLEDFSDDDQIKEPQPDEPYNSEEETMELEPVLEEDVIEKILACRYIKAAPTTTTTTEQEAENSEDLAAHKMEFLCKFKDWAYMHCKWLKKSEIDSQQNGGGKLQRFLKNFGGPEYFLDTIDGSFFNPDFLEVDRILGTTVTQGRRYYLIKWKALPYNEMTWELASIVHDKAKVEHYKRYRKPPVNYGSYRYPKRPHPREFSKLKTSPTFKDGNQLREYQMEGLNWLIYCWYNRRNSILADEMGLGKTVQSISMLDYLRRYHNNRGPFLIVAPLSTVMHWKREAENWTYMNAIVFHGSAEARQKAKSFDFYHVDSRGKLIPYLYKFHVLITTYEIVLAESSILSKIPWQYMIVDEGHRLKNKNSKLLEHLQKFNSVHKLLLTGTPIQNDMGELWSLLHFLDPKRFNSRDSFMTKYGNMQGAKDIEELHKEIGPYLLRRLKGDVEKSIPPKEEIVVEVIPTKIQKMYLRAVMDKNREFLRRGVSKSNNVPSLMNVLMEVRKVCNHPFLVSGAEEVLTNNHVNKEQTNAVQEFLITCSSKLVLVDKLLKKLREGKHKVLIFSQMVAVLNILEDYMNYRKYPYCRLDGTIRGDDRQMAIDRFNNPAIDTFVFLVSTRAGGVGINLTSADTVIIYDSDWNPQNDLQAQARCHRIGQTKEVKVYRLLTKDTKEKEMFAAASRKLGLDRAVLNSSTEFYVQGGNPGASNNAAAKQGLEKEELNLLLKYGAYVAMRDDTEEEKMLMEGDIDKILERNSTVVRYDQQQDKGLSSFSKASFTVSKDDMEVDLDDKDFWSKILPEMKNAQGLTRKLADKSFEFKGEAEMDTFLQDVHNLVQERIAEHKRLRQSAAVADDNDPLGILLTQVMYCFKLPESKRSIARVWLDQIDAPRLRSGARDGDDTTNNDDNDNADDDVGGSGADDEDHVIVAGSEHPSSLRKGVSFENLKRGGWFKAERARLMRALLDHGWNKWEYCRTAFKLENHTVDVIHALCESVLQQIMLHDETCKPFLMGLIQVKSNSSNSKPTNEETEEAATTTTTTTTTTETETTSNLIELEACQYGAQELKMTRLPTTLQHPCTYELLDVDQELIVRTMTDTVEKQEAAAAEDADGDTTMQEKEQPIVITNKRTSIVAPGYYSTFVLRITDANHVQYTSAPFAVNALHPCLLVEEHLDAMKRGYKNWLKKLKYTSDLQLLIHAYGPQLTSAPIPTIPIKKPADWFDAVCDRELLCAFYEYGWNKIDEARKDDKYSFKSKFAAFVAKQKSGRDKKRAEETFPTIAILGKRAQRLIQDTLAKDSKLSKSKLNASSSRHVTNEWSKREKEDLKKCLYYFGTCCDQEGNSRYELLAERANLRKTTEAVEDFVERFVASLQQQVDAATNNNNNNNNKTTSTTITNVDDEDDDAKENKQTTTTTTTTDEPETATTTTTDDEVMEDAAAATTTTTTDNDNKLKNEFMEEISAGSAAKLLQRIDIMDKLSRCVFPSYKSAADKLALIKTGGLPRWYKAKDHDIDLLKGVEKHGLEFKKILSDTELCFHSMNNTNKKGNLIREGVALARLEDIAKYYEKANAYGSPSKDAQQWKDNLTPKKTHVSFAPQRKRTKLETTTTTIDKKTSAPAKKTAAAAPTKKEDKPATASTSAPPKAKKRKRTSAPASDEPAAKKQKTSASLDKWLSPNKK